MHAPSSTLCHFPYCEMEVKCAEKPNLKFNEKEKIFYIYKNIAAYRVSKLLLLIICPIWVEILQSKYYSRFLNGWTLYNDVIVAQYDTYFTSLPAVADYPVNTHPVNGSYVICAVALSKRI